MEKIVILDFGSQYTQLIARRVRELQVYCEIFPYNHDFTKEQGVKGVILSGSPSSVFDLNHLEIDFQQLFSLHVPILAICYGAQLTAFKHGGNVQKSHVREYGRAVLSQLDSSNLLFKDLSENTQVWMSHGDTIIEIPKEATRIASTDTVKHAAYYWAEHKLWALQFHPEVTHTAEGKIIIKNFISYICKCLPIWNPASYIESTISDIKATVGSDHVLLGLSGGVDSTVAAALIHKAIGSQLTCIFIDNGLLRLNEYEEVLASYQSMALNVIGVDASSAFYTALAGETDPERKRKAIGKTFIDVFDLESKKINNVKWLAQGTIYPDVIESVNVKGPSATIKSHHNVGGLPAKMNLKLVEPLKALFKDEVRKVGAALGVPDVILKRHPFPGPGLAIRILGDVTPEKVLLCQKADAIFINALKTHQLYDNVWQAGAILLPVQSVGVMGDERTYEQVVALRAVSSIDGMTADWVHFEHAFLAEVSNTIINKVKGINRVVYDISSKPPATIEWE